MLAFIYNRQLRCWLLVSS